MGALYILAPADDAGAHAVSGAVVSLLPETAAFRWVTAEELAHARWSWHLRPCATEPRASSAGGPILGDGTRLAFRREDVVLNRLPEPNPPAFCAASAKDRDYAQLEAAAIQRAWLEGAPAVVLNRPGGPASLAFGRVPWLGLARRAGLPLRRFVGSVARRAAVASGYEIRPISANSWSTVLAGDPAALLPGSTPSVALEELGAPYLSVLLCHGVADGTSDIVLLRGCRALAEFAGATLLQIGFGTDRNGGWRFDTATTMPDLSAEPAAFVAKQMLALMHAANDTHDPLRRNTL